MFPYWVKNLFPKKSRPAPRRRPARVRLGLEALESRLVPTVFASLNGGQLVVSTNSHDFLTLDHSGSMTLLNNLNNPVNHFAFPDAAITNGIKIQPDFDTVAILATVKPVTAGGENSVLVGSTSDTVPGTLQNIRAPLSLGSNPNVFLEDRADPSGHFLTVNVVNFVVSVTDMAPFPITCNVFGGFFGELDLQTFKLRGGEGHNIWNILDTPGATRFSENVTTTDIFSGPSNDQVTVRGTSSSILNLQGQSRDSVFIGHFGDLDTIHSQVNISNPPSYTDLQVTGRLTSGRQNVTMSVANGFGTIQGLAPGNITYHTPDVSRVSVSGHGTFIVNDTFKNSSFDTTEIHTGGGNDLVKVDGTTGKLNISNLGFAGVIIGGDIDTLNHIQGNINVSNADPGRTQLIVHGQADNFDHLVTMDVIPMPDAPSVGRISGLAQAPFALLTYDPASISAISIFGGSGNDIFFIEGTPVNVPVIIFGGLGHDIFSIGSTRNSLDTIGGPLFINGGFGPAGNTLVVRDEGAEPGHTYTQSSNQIVRTFVGDFGDITPPVIINFARMNRVRLFQSPPIGGAAAAARDLDLTWRVRVGETARLTGTLVDDDPSQVLSLTVNWGDGSDPETSTPDRDPFEVTHTYDSPGRYTVHVTWSDSDGRSNGRDLILRVRPARSGGHGPERGDGGDGDDGADAVFALLGGEGDHHRKP
jgi:hypothetical protein